VATGDAPAWSAAIAALLDDPPRRDALRSAGRERVAAFDWSVVAAAVLRVYEAAVAADPRRVGAGGRLSTPAPPRTTRGRGTDLRSSS
jgi:phosphatidylinositol alpha-mannosyltransferase